MRAKSNLCEAVFSVLCLTSLLLFSSVPGFARDKYETIDATAWGTSTQLGRNIGVTLIIYEWSTPDDKATLVEAFQKGSNKGLVNALERMKAVGHVNITGTLGFDCSYIALIPTPTGRKIRFVTNRQIKFRHGNPSDPDDPIIGGASKQISVKANTPGCYKYDARAFYPGASYGMGGAASRNW